MSLGMNKREAAAWGRLQDALRVANPACAADGRFVLDDLPPDETEQMRRLCATCPLLTECTNYADTAQTLGGFWAGRHRGYKTTKGTGR